MSTWYDLKLATLQKVFAADDEIEKDESTYSYLAAMPHVANEGLALLATAGKFITKSVKITQMNIENLLSKSIADTIHEFTGTHTIDASEGQSFYFEYSGQGTCVVKVNGSVYKTINLDSKSYKAYRDILSNPYHYKVELVFTTVYPMALKNIAIYKERFYWSNDVPPYTDKVKYDMKALAPDFYMIDPQGIYYEGERQTYLQTSDFYQEGTKTLVLDRDMVGSFTVYYRAYPEEITKDTLDTYELPIDPEVYALLPLYMASQIYKDDDFGVATSYRNEFEIGFERLVNSANINAYEEWTSESRWI